MNHKSDMCDEIGGFTVAKAFTKKKLKSPSTAEFASFSESTVRGLDNCTYRVTSYVDAQNNFGANIRSNYTAQVKGNKNTEVWTLESIVFH